MDNPLAIYLHDHLAGATFALDLLEAMRDKRPSDLPPEFAAVMHKEIAADRAVLQDLADRIGAGSSPLKEMTAWLSEKVSRFKLARDPRGLGTFEALEFLAMGVLGKLALWKALAVVASDDSRLEGLDFAKLIARAADQHARFEERRLETAKIALVHHSSSEAKGTPLLRA
jgi:hypothetical protein